VNGTSLNEVGINALIASEYGVSVSLVSGDDVLIRETREILGNDFVGIVTKYGRGSHGGNHVQPARVRRMLQDSAAVAVRRARSGAFKPYRLAKPYRVSSPCAAPIRRWWCKVWTRCTGRGSRRRRIGPIGWSRRMRASWGTCSMRSSAWCSIERPRLVLLGAALIQQPQQPALAAAPPPRAA